MLRELRVRNLAILEDVRVPFAPGLNVITGATGSGKSLLLGALELLLGGRASREMLRTGADELRVEGLFEVPDAAQRAALTELLGDDAFADEDTLVLRRRIDAAGRSKCDAQGAMVPVATLREIGRRLVEIHGQSEHQALLDPAAQTEILDRAGDLVAQRGDFAGKLRAWNAAKDALAAATAGRAERDARLERLDATIDEIRAVKLRAGELDELRAERSLLADATRHAEAVATALRLVDGGDGTAGEGTSGETEEGALDRIGRAARGLEHTARVDADVKEALAALEDAASRASDAARTLRAAADRIEANPARLEEVEDRIEKIGRVLRRHGPGEDDALRTLAEAVAAVAEIRGNDLSSDELAARAAALGKDVLVAGRALDAARRKAGAKLSKAVVATLAELGMEGTRFELAPADLGDDAAARATSLGLSAVEFLVAPNKGEDLRPLAKIASGGELARIALALRGEIAGGGDVALLVFDEIDADVGPRMGGVIGARLAALAKSRQVLAVTHLPQVAEAAAHHIRAAKRTDGDRTVTAVEVLEGRARREEIEDMRGEGARRRSSGSSGASGPGGSRG